MIRVLNEAERKAYHNRYRSNDLFRSWKSVLARHEKSDIGIDPMSVWAYSDKLLQELRDTAEERPEMAEELCLEALRKNEENQVVAVMATIVVRLMNATEKGHEDDVIPNDALCLAIMTVMQKHLLFKSLIDELFACKVGYDGQEIVIAPHDPMTEDITYGDLPETHQQDVEDKVQPIEQQSEEERVKQAIIAMFEKTYKDSDKPIFSEKCQWSAIYHVLKEKELTDKTLCEFAEWVNSLVDENRVPCTEHSLRKKKGICYNKEKSRWESEDSGKSGNHMCQLLNRIDTIFRKELEILDL